VVASKAPAKLIRESDIQISVSADAVVTWGTDLHVDAEEKEEEEGEGEKGRNKLTRYYQYISIRTKMISDSLSIRVIRAMYPMSLSKNIRVVPAAGLIQQLRDDL
jgi:hypothetical protein